MSIKWFYCLYAREQKLIKLPMLYLAHTNNSINVKCCKYYTSYEKKCEYYSSYGKFGEF